MGCLSMFGVIDWVRELYSKYDKSFLVVQGLVFFC
jgi:hypothetical protein